MPLSNLNEEQYKAATTPLGHNLIIASAGTGKTSTIVARIAYLLEKGVNPKDILLLTFTNKAAQEMINRIAKYFPEEAKKLEAGTFHAVGYRLLKSFGKKIVLKQPRELKILFKSIYEKRAFYHIESDIKPYLSSYLYDIYSLYRNSSLKPFDEFLEEKNEEHKPYFEIYEDIIYEFEELKEKYGYVNFDDLLTGLIKELDNQFLAYKEILVDEYQDTNPLQNSMIKALNTSSLFCVGDYDQSIYAFNGSDIGIIGGFNDVYHNARIYTLTKNYRSTKSILALANKVIQNNERIYPKKLEVVRIQSNISPTLLTFDELYEQYIEIATRISQSTTTHEELAVIFRNNSAADGIEASLREFGIKAKRKGGISFFESREIKSALDLCTLIVNPKDMMSFIHVFEYAKGIGAAIAKDIFEALGNLGDGDIIEGLIHPKNILNPFNKRVKNFQLGLFDDFYELGSLAKFKEAGFEDEFLSNPILKHPKLNLEGGEFLYEFYLLYKKLKQIKKPSSILEAIKISKLYSFVIDHLSSQRAQKKDGTIDEKEKEGSMERIDRKMRLLIDLSSHYNQLERFVNAMVLGSGEIGNSEGVNLLTVHASKGLEFEEVYIVDLMEGRFPNSTLVSKGGSIEEERRLFYVAVTRAKDKLILSYAKYDRVRKQDHVPSQFLKEAGMVG